MQPGCMRGFSLGPALGETPFPNAVPPRAEPGCNLDVTVWGSTRQNLVGRGWNLVDLPANLPDSRCTYCLRLVAGDLGGAARQNQKPV